MLVWPWKMVLVSVRFLFYQPMDENIKTWTLRFPPKKTLIRRRHCSIGQSCCSMTSKRRIGWFLESSRPWSFSAERSPNQSKATRLCIRSINQSNSSSFPFVFVSRSYENRSIKAKFVLGILDSLEEDSTCIARAVRQALLLASCFSVVSLSAWSLVLLVNCV